jgi:hypothetical protein
MTTRRANMETHNPNRQSAENLFTSAVNRVKQSPAEQIQRVEDYTRRSPFAALGIAAAAGFMLRGLPVRALAGLFLRLALVLARPFIFVCGAVNLYHFLRSRNGSSPAEEYTPGETGKHRGQ